MKHKAVPKKTSVVFHYTTTLESEYESLFEMLDRVLPRKGFPLKLVRRGYDETTVMETVEELLNQSVPATAIVELPLATAGRLLSDPARKGKYKVTGSSYTFTSERPKVAVCYLAQDPQREVRRLLCASRDSIASQLFRYYAATRRWDIQSISAQTQEMGSYSRLLDVVETICGAPHADAVLGDCACVLSGQHVMERMESITAKHRDRLPFRMGYDLYTQAKENVRRALFGDEAGREMPDLPGSVLVTRSDSNPSALSAFMGVVDQWGEEHETSLRHFGMARPHVGTPVPVVGTVVFMEQMAHALEGLEDPLHSLDYDDFILAPAAAKWLNSDVRHDAVKAIHAAATHLLTSVMDAERAAAEDFESYFGGAYGSAAAERGPRPPLAGSFHSTRQSLRDLAVFFTTVVRALPTVSGGAAMKDRILSLRGKVQLPILVDFINRCADQYGSAYDVREISPTVIRAAFDAIVAIKREFRKHVRESGIAPPPPRALLTQPERPYLTLAHPDDASLTLRLDRHEYASKQLSSPGKAPLLRILFHLIQHGEGSTRALIRDALGFDIAYDADGRVLGKQGKNVLKANTFYSYCQRLREFFPFITSNHRGTYLVDYEGARHRIHPDDLARLRRG